ncbi:lipase family protein [Nocardia sp. NPDC060220]|uniref:lipase family protein n=1 Tax=Nocardia sp. NPDC060220 TaxID=3347076 RepID=UPI0036603340
MGGHRTRGDRPASPFGIRYGRVHGRHGKAEIAAAFAGWAPEVGEVIERTPEDAIVSIRPRTHLDGHRDAQSGGIDFLHSTANECVSGTVARWAFRDTRDFTVTGQPIMTSLRADPAVRAVIDSFALGTIAPADPVMLLQNINDDAVPAGPARQLSVDWCAKGADVIYHELDYPPLLPEIGLFGHSATILGADVAMAWLADRLAGVPAQASCR